MLFVYGGGRRNGGVGRNSPTFPNVFVHNTMGCTKAFRM